MNQKKSILLELHYLPPIQYFTKLIRCDILFLEQCEHYQKGSYRNRCHIATANGLQRLSIPLKKGKNEQQLIREVRIAYDEPWQAKHWQSIRSAYGNAPYFEFYSDVLEPFYSKRYRFLFDWNWDFFESVIDLLSIDCEVKFTNNYKEPDNNYPFLDLRNSIHPKPHRSKEDPYFSPVKYAQVFEEKHGFLPNLSVLDLLFCTGPQSLEILEDCCKLNEEN